ncbi:Putative two-domain glycosyltransferase [Rhodovulum sp. P5]|uniref:glycosyltransferase n=1 Tax=Rhodovulum sp. P5 TaxID=1564506 RepID=UPI0009C39CD9|nr:glycosyltransferase [Rhodovulum sp. P5]ARE40522.1 Putative two-domain glycosyltransferase [Rhodovulum sp. P5]
MQSELILSTYNSPRSLALCLESIAMQRVRTDGICIADDGSGPETKAVIDAFAARHPDLTIRHVWHEDRGFEKSAILNKAIASSQAAVLVFIDGDVMIHPDFVARHLHLTRPGQFSTGSLIRLDAEATASVTPEMVRDGTVFDRDWLKANRALGSLSTWAKTRPFPVPVMDVLERLSPVRRALCGANASVWRSDLLKINGYDETIKWGGGDKNLGIRLNNAGVRGRHLRYSAPLVHLDHPRGYADPEKKKRYRALNRAARKSGETWTPNGINKEGRT